MAGNGKKPNIRQSPKYRNLAANVAECLARGGNIAGVAAKFRISRECLYQWLKTEHFQGLLEQKKEDWRLKLLGEIEGAGAKEWTANAWLLERVFKGEYNPPHLNRDKTPPVIFQFAINTPRDQN